MTKELTKEELVNSEMNLNSLKTIRELYIKRKEIEFELTDIDNSIGRLILDYKKRNNYPLDCLFNIETGEYAIKKEKESK